MQLSSFLYAENQFNMLKRSNTFVLFGKVWNEWHSFTSTATNLIHDLRPNNVDKDPNLGSDEKYYIKYLRTENR